MFIYSFSLLHFNGNHLNVQYLTGFITGIILSQYFMFLIPLIGYTSFCLLLAANFSLHLFFSAKTWLSVAPKPFRKFEVRSDFSLLWIRAVWQREVSVQWPTYSCHIPVISHRRKCWTDSKANAHLTHEEQQVSSSRTWFLVMKTRVKEVF